ncbi:MAG: hypothetical protein R3Y11_03870 [Pseudomonadota bacterium]
MEKLSHKRCVPYANRHEARAAYDVILREATKHGPQAQVAAVAMLGRLDLFFLLSMLLRQPWTDNDWCFERCKEVAAAPDGRLDLWAREHFKSTIITFALTIQDILCDPEITIGIFSHTRPIAKAFLTQIKREFEDNPILLSLYPDVLYQSPKTDSPQWSLDSGIVVKRKGNPKEATVEAWGLVDGQPTGRHFKLSVYDDVVTAGSVTTPDIIAKVTEMWALSLNLGSRGGAQRYIGTRYHFNDTYRTMMDREAASPRIHPATDDGTMDGVPVLLSRKVLLEKRRIMGPYVFGCQMLQNPKADDVSGFTEEWMRYWEPKKDLWQGMNRYILVDPAHSKKQGSDYTVMWVVGFGADGHRYVIDGVRDRMNLTERTRQLFTFVREYKPLCVGYERYGLQADIEHINGEQDRLGYHFSIIEMGGAMPKNDRIRRLVPLFEQGRIFFPGNLSLKDMEGKWRNLTEEFVREEYLAFPVCSHDDMLDCLARQVEDNLGASFPDEDDYAEYVGGMPNDPRSLRTSQGLDDYDPLSSWES